MAHILHFSEPSVNAIMHFFEPSKHLVQHFYEPSPPSYPAQPYDLQLPKSVAFCHTINFLKLLSSIPLFSKRIPAWSKKLPLLV